MAMAAEQYPEEYGEQYGEQTGGGDMGFSASLPEGWEFLDSHVKNAIAHPRLTDEEKMAQKVMAKRRVEMERRARIFDCKRRTIGVDKAVLDQQVMEMRMRKEEAAAQNRADDGTLARADKQLKLMEIEKQRLQRQMETHCKNYSLENLSFQTRREFDLNDPKAIRTGIPARLGDDDPRCGPASMQQFNGEDLMKAERVRQQRAAQVNFIEQQKFEKAMLANAEDGSDAAFAAEVAAITALRDEMERGEEHLRRDLQRTQQHNNLQTSSDNAQRKNALKEYENDLNQRELSHHYTDPFLNELAPKVYPNGKTNTRECKGATRDDKVQVMKDQLAQIEENRHRRGGDRFDDLLQASENNMTRKHLVAMEREKAKAKRRLATQMSEENRKLAIEKVQNKQAVNEMYTNKFNPEFFEQFGKGTR
eukprot:TRINITY_DN102343_c0_g1_i1.p2 TRINITY_DN102343_c0_g1~~TRINITY_DN102343_c0_g1_i1.p2  ORF type:complete len:421 (-),score=168.34 TRINITY_DN102343_c0_g1_i1:320-1582(-)